MHGWERLNALILSICNPDKTIIPYFQRQQPIYVSTCGSSLCIVTVRTQKPTDELLELESSDRLSRQLLEAKRFIFSTAWMDLSIYKFLNLLLLTLP